MGTLGFIWRAPRRRPALAATLFVLVVSLSAVLVRVLPRIHDERVVFSVGSVLGAVLVAFLGAAAMDWREGLILEPWQLRKQLKIEVLAELDADLMERVRAELSGASSEKAAPAAPQTALTTWAPQTASAESPTGMATAEQFDGFRELRMRLLATAAGAQLMPFTTLVVPLVRGSGGSFVARNLAASFASQDGTSALLIDCNLAHPTQHVALGTSDDEGLFDFLEEPRVRFSPKPTGIRGLYLIPSGRPRSQFREYFSSSRMRGLINFVRESGRFVFLDGPAVKGSPDARILSEIADFVILVVGSGKGRAGDVAQAVAMFDPAKLAGVVFNERA